MGLRTNPRGSLLLSFSRRLQRLKLKVDTELNDVFNIQAISLLSLLILQCTFVSGPCVSIMFFPLFYVFKEFFGVVFTILENSLFMFMFTLMFFFAFPLYSCEFLAIFTVFCWHEFRRRSFL